MKNILILGFGELGKGVAGLYKDNTEYTVYIRDTAYKEDRYIEEPFGAVINAKGIKDIPAITVLHVCIPYTPNFLSTIVSYIKEYTPELTIINSTVDIGITMDVFRYTDTDVVHSPIMGRHPNLTESIRTFKKIVAGPNKTSVDKAVAHFKELGVKTEVYKKPEESEAAKLLSTSYFGWNILFMKYVYKLCEEHGLDFESVYTKTNKIYNDGYTELGESQFIRPILKYIPGKIGGHCIRENFDIIKNRFFPASISLKLDNEFEDDSV